jgi:threonine dehydrogenase-like Zn-dependent dehydrogenase
MVPDPQPKEAEVLVAVRACGICGSDAGLWTQPGPKPGVHGHEIAGVVERCGPGVERWKAGDRVAVMAVVGCGTCPDCLRGRANYCASGPRGLAGGFGELMAAPERCLVPVPDDIPFEVACLLTDCVGTPARAVRRSGAGPDDLAAVFGCGPIGLMAIQVLRAAGSMPIAVDSVEYRLAAAIECGAAHTVSALNGDAAETIRRLSGAGAHLAFECSGQAGKQALACVRPGGRVAFVGECGHLDVSPSEDFIRRQVEAFGSWYITRSDYFSNIDLVRSGRVRPEAVITHRLPFDQIARGFDLFCGRKDGCLKVVLTFGSS